MFIIKLKSLLRVNEEGIKRLLMKSADAHKVKKQQAIRTGKWAEIAAAWYLRFKGYRIVARNVTTPVAQIDLVARRGKTYIIVEVKYRQSMVEAFEAIRQMQQKRLIRGAKYLMKSWPHSQQATIRFDAVLMAPKSWPHHVQNAWWEGSTCF